ncbi:LysR substrate-binding domain-containing protein [Streptacidiphilus jiangxiensis]|uniref:DNA-binding transcriptional regulator, LysR family n=1 Tax=Streptacidiphilus jiangxiensis TaxID=235985 RepID=A0A1H7P4F1_STRJI|nr:LysR substrate-binding domain-containing protein [Streptacidiphilus jiangxiensis]SEL30489.1 DNA-binding transcriptional regulator, LysR family [Streptacidiphilus jiangxiensis]
MDLDPRQLRYFLAVAEELHFGRAAARLYIAQPSLSNQIRALENALGVELFERSRRKVELTAAGRALLEEAPLALAALERAAERTRQAGAGLAGTVRLGYAPMAGYETLGAVLAAIEQDSPELTVLATEHFSSEISARVLAGDLDAGIALFPEPMPGIRSSLLRSEPLALLCGKDHRLADSDPVEIADLREESLLLFPRELAPGYYDRVVSACERSGFHPHIRTFTDPPPQAMVARLQAGREIGLPPASFAFHTAAGDRRYAASRVVEPEIRVDWSIVWSARTRSSAVARLLEASRRCANEQGWLLPPHDEAATDASNPSAQVITGSTGRAEG